MQILILKKQQNDFQKDFFKLINNSVFGKTMENVRKHRDIKLVTPEKKKKLFGSSYHTTKLLTEQLLAAKMKRKTQTNIYKPVYLGLKTVRMSFGMTMWNWNIKKKQNNVLWILIVLLYTEKEMTFIKIMQKLFK